LGASWVPEPAVGPGKYHEPLPQFRLSRAFEPAFAARRRRFDHRRLAGCFARSPDTRHTNIERNDASLLRRRHSLPANQRPTRRLDGDTTMPNQNQNQNQNQNDQNRQNQNQNDQNQQNQNNQNQNNQNNQNQNQQNQNQNDQNQSQQNRQNQSRNER
jgi:hypothetical protein